MNLSVSQPYSCVIIDDSRMSKQLFENFVSKIDKLELKGSFTDKVDAMAAFWTFGKVDFLFLDVQMDMSGIDVARMLKNSVKYVVILGNQGTQAIDNLASKCKFLPKPLDFTKFLNTIEQLISI
ncbi:response regulator [Pedobacter miscanthi]|uniref:response regulator n=1 Tax=Pedobacter miscanthi TaxID=2259170 RepID=UPI00292E7D6A|nr:response regulator [Pedobacter miscanthi]